MFSTARFFCKDGHDIIIIANQCLYPFIYVHDVVLVLKFETLHAMDCSRGSKKQDIPTSDIHETRFSIMQDMG